MNDKLNIAQANQKALALMAEDVRNNRTIYPNDADLQNAEFQLDVGDAITVYEKFWEKLKAAKKD